VTKSKERIKKTGEVFTPQWLVDQMLDELPQDLFVDPEKTFIDPACGDGNFLVRVLRRKIEGGSEPLKALQTTYGVDLMEDNIHKCRKRLFYVAFEYDPNPNLAWRDALFSNIKAANTLETSLEDIFTVNT
jgi:type I restriction-modification system DNA methylase subunit